MPNQHGFRPSDAEKKAFEETLALEGRNRPVAVSQRPCAHCQTYFAARARHLGEDIVLVDPQSAWVFRPDGQIFELPR